MFSFQFSRLNSAGNEVDYGGAIVAVDGDAQDVTGNDNIVAFLPRDDGARGAGSAGHIAVYGVAGLAGGDSRFAAIVKAGDGLFFGLVQVEASAVHENVAGSCHVKFLLLSVATEIYINCGSVGIPLFKQDSCRKCRPTGNFGHVLMRNLRRSQEPTVDVCYG